METIGGASNELSNEWINERSFLRITCTRRYPWHSTVV